MKKILSLMFLLGILTLGVANADSPVVAPDGGDAQASIDLLNASAEEAPIVIAGTKRRNKTKSPSISCCNSDGSCQVTREARCFIQGGTQAPSACSTTPPQPDPACTAD